MTIAYDASAEKEVAASPASPQTWTHTPVGTPKGIAVCLTQLAGTSSSTDYISAVTYGGVALTRIKRAIDSAAGKGSADIWFLGASIPTGAQTVSVTFTSVPPTRYHLVSISMTGTVNTEVVTSGSIDNNTADPSLTLAYGGRTCLAIAAEYCGKSLVADFTPNANCTTVHTYAPTATGTLSTVFRQTTPDSADFTIGGTMTLDDSAFVAVAFSEVVVPPASTSDVASATFPLGTETTGGTITIPVTVQTGDDVYVLVLSRDHNAAVANVTVVDNDAGGNAFALLQQSADRKANRFWKKATAGTAGKTVTVAGAVGSCAAGLTPIRGALADVDPSTNAALVSPAGAASYSIAGFTPDYANSEICLGIFNYQRSNATVASMACTSPGTLEPEHFLCTSSGGNDCQVIFGSAPQSGGLTGTGNFTWSQNSSQVHAMTWGVRPAVVAPPASVSTALQNPVFKYAAPGTYSVKLIVMDNDGHLSTVSTRSVTVS